MGVPTVLVVEVMGLVTAPEAAANPHPCSTRSLAVVVDMVRVPVEAEAPAVAVTFSRTFCAPVSSQQAIPSCVVPPAEVRVVSPPAATLVPTQRFQVVLYVELVPLNTQVPEPVLSVMDAELAPIWATKATRRFPAVADVMVRVLVARTPVSAELRIATAISGHRYTLPRWSTRGVVDEPDDSVAWTWWPRSSWPGGSRWHSRCSSSRTRW